MFKAAFTYIIFSALGRSGAFLLLPLLTTNLSKEDYGSLAIFTNLMICITPLISLNANITLSRNFSGDHYHTIRQLQNNSVLTFFLIVIILPFILSLFSGDVDVRVIFFSVLASFVGSLNSLQLMKLQLINNAKKFGFYQLLAMSANITATLFFFLADQLDFSTRAIAIILGLYLPFFREINSAVVGVSLKLVNLAWLKVGVKLLPLSFMTWALLHSDKLLMSHFHGLSQAGGYFLVYTLCLPVELILNGFGRVIYNKIYQYKKERLQQSRHVLLFSVTAIFICVCYVPVANFILDNFIDPKFADDKVFIVPIISYILLSHVASMMQTILLSEGDNKVVTFINIIAILAYGASVFFNYSKEAIYIPLSVSFGYVVLISILAIKILKAPSYEAKS